MTTECTCPPAPAEYQHRYGNATEPGSALEYDPECPEHGRSGRESPRGNPTGVTTTTGGAERGSNTLSPTPGAFPDVRLLTDEDDGSQHALVRSSDLDYPWASMQIGDPENQDGWLDSAAARAEHLVPVGPLLELVEQWSTARNLHLTRALNSSHEDDWSDDDEGLLGAEYGRRADELRGLLASLLGDPPESPAQQEIQ